MRNDIVELGIAIRNRYNLKGLFTASSRRVLEEYRVFDIKVTRSDDGRLQWQRILQSRKDPEASGSASRPSLCLPLRVLLYDYGFAPFFPSQLFSRVSRRLPYKPKLS